MAERCRKRTSCRGTDPQKLNQYLARLQKLSEEFNLAVILTNQVQADPGVSGLHVSCVVVVGADCQAAAMFAAAASAKPVGGELLRIHANPR